MWQARIGRQALESISASAGTKQGEEADFGVTEELKEVGDIGVSADEGKGLEKEVVAKRRKRSEGGEIPDQQFRMPVREEMCVLHEIPEKVDPRVCKLAIRKRREQNVPGALRQENPGVAADFYKSGTAVEGASKGVLFARSPVSGTTIEGGSREKGVGQEIHT